MAERLAERLVPMATPENSVELRGDCPRDVIDVIDAISAARRLTRTQLVNEILGDWVRQKLHEVKLVHRVARSNPGLAESDGGATDRLRLDSGFGSLGGRP